MASGTKAKPATAPRVTAKPAAKAVKTEAKPAKATAGPAKAAAKPVQLAAKAEETHAMPAATPEEIDALPIATKDNGAGITEHQFRNFVEVAAYYIAERRGFQGGNSLEDWVQAEIEVARMLREHRINL